MKRIAPYYKAAAGIIVPLLGAIVVALQDNSPGGSSITASEWVGAAIIALTTGGTVYKVRNRPRPVRRVRPKAARKD